MEKENNMSPALKTWFDRYSDDHRDQTNKRIHFICVPLIFFSVLGLLSLPGIQTGAGDNNGLFERITPAHLLALVALVFYARHSFALFLGIAIFTMACTWIIGMIYNQDLFPAWAVFSFVFAMAWIGQFIGHKHEGRKPSFLTDLVFLLIGPAWIIGFIYRKLGIAY